MGTGRSFSHGGDRLLLIVTVLVIPQLVCGIICDFGTNNTKDLVLRNQTLITYMNNNLYYRTRYITTQIRNVSTFNLTTFLQSNLGLNIYYLSRYVSEGRLLLLNWTAITQGYWSSIALPRYILYNYVNVAQTNMQRYADLYSFSLGIFRPRWTQYNYTGINYTSTGSALLYRGICLAGSQVVLSIRTNMTYNPTIINRNSPNFAIFATMIEIAFDSFFRALFTHDFVRLSVLYTYGYSSYSSGFYTPRIGARVEVYFKRNYTSSYIQNYTKIYLYKLPALIFNNGTIIRLSINATDIQSITENSTMATDLVTEQLKTTLALEPIATEMSTEWAEEYFEINNLTFPAEISSESSTVVDTHNPVSSTVVKTTPIGANTNTFDPDPFFKAVVPVVTKIYNDRRLLPVILSNPRHDAPTASISIKQAFLSITIPATIGMFSIILGCMLCLQTEWLAKLRK